MEDTAHRQAAEALAQLGSEEALRLLSSAKARLRHEQQKRLRWALPIVAAKFFRGWKLTPMAEEIELAAHGKWAIRSDADDARGAASQRSAVRRCLLELLGDLKLVPGARRIRQLLGGK